MSDKSFEKSLNNLNESMKELIFLDIDEAKALIRERGLDPEAEIAEGLRFIKRMSFQAKAKLNEENDASLLETAFNRIKSLIAQYSDQSGDLLKKVLQDRAPSFQFRNLEKLGDDEIKEILRELDLIKLMEEIDAQNKDTNGNI